MRLRFLGTGAATAAPLPFCQCDFCRELRQRRVFRRRAALLIDEGLLIDFGPDVPQMAAEMNVDLTQVYTVLQTHSHADHFDAGHWVTRIPGYAPEGLGEVLLAGSAETMAHIREKMMREEGDAADLMDEAAAEAMRILPRAVPVDRPFYTCRYDILPLAVPHDVRDGSVIYVVHSTSDERTILYATDCPRFPQRVWDALSGYRLDCAILDHTYGSLPHLPSTSHMDAPTVAEMVETMRIRGILKPGAPAYATHISHEAQGSVQRMQDYAAQHGYLLAEDGLDILI